MHISGIHGRVLGVLVDKKHERIALTRALAGADISDYVCATFNPVNLCQRFDQRGCSGRLDRFFVHEAQIEIADFLCVAAGLLVLVSRGFLDQDAQIFLGPVRQHGKTAVVRLVFRNLGVFQPGSIRVAIKIVLRPHCRVEIGGLDTRSQRLFGHRRPIRFLAAGGKGQGA